MSFTEFLYGGSPGSEDANLPLANLAEVPAGCSLSALSALYWIAIRGRTMGELSTKLKVSRAAATGTVDKLEREGLAERCRDEEDRRCITVVPTASGRAIAQRVFAVSASVSDDVGGDSRSAFGSGLVKPPPKRG